MSLFLTESTKEETLSKKKKKENRGGGERKTLCFLRHKHTLLQDVHRRCVRERDGAHTRGEEKESTRASEVDRERESLWGFTHEHALDGVHGAWRCACMRERERARERARPRGSD